MTRRVGPCGWDVEICQDCCSDAFSALPSLTAEALKASAANFLWRATGKRYGLCETTYRPCASRCAGTSGLMYPAKIGADWVNLSCNACGDSCGCGGVISEIYIPGTYAVTGIVVDGEELDPLDTVLVYDYSRLVRADGSAWPTCQDLSAPSDPVSGQAGTWQVTVLEGFPVPPGGELMAGILACELAKACTNDSSCRLPKRTQTISRNGITVGFQDMFDGLDEMKTGLWEVDAWIVANRFTGYQEPTLASPDLPSFPFLTFPVPS